MRKIRNKILSIYLAAENKRHDSALFMYIYILIKTIHLHPIMGILFFLRNITLSYILSYKIFGASIIPKVIFDIKPFKIEINKHKKTKITSSNKVALVFKSFFGDTSKSIISIECNGALAIKNTFYIGNNVKIIIGPNAKLEINGSRKITSGISLNTIIMSSKKINIGYDTIISWGVYISDSSRHKINDVIKQGNISIGDNVWISEGATISYGTIIESGAIVGSKSFVQNNHFSQNTLIAGSPGKVIKNNINWTY